MKTTIIAAIDRERGLGSDNQLLCHLPEDMAWFKKRTYGKPVVMGRKTAQSLPRPLPGRLNLVLTRSSSSSNEGVLPPHDAIVDPEGFVYVSSIPEAKQLAKAYIETHPLSKDFPAKEMMVIGGAEIYRLFLPEAFSLVLTHIEHTFQADVFFPSFEKAFVLTSHREVPSKSYTCRFATYHRA